jgi:phenylacetate-CoA ligase
LLAPRVEETIRSLESGEAPSFGALRARLVASPYWREVLRAAGASPWDLRAVDDLRAFPMLTRDALRERWKDVPGIFAGEEVDLVAVASSGTTGDPVRVMRDPYDRVHMWAVLRFWLRRSGISLPVKPRVVLVDSLPGGLEYSVRLPLVGDGALHRVSIHHARAAERIARVAPAVIFSDPAGLHWLGGETHGARLLLTSAQRFARTQRAAFAAPIVNYYATTETGPIAWECLARENEDVWHVLHPEIVVESVDGEIVVTRLRESVLPLLRYRTGDAGDVSSWETCGGCGAHGPVIRGFSGRSACWFITPSGARVDAWQLAWIFKHTPLTSFRLTQIGARHFTLALTDAGDVNELMARLTSALHTLGFDDAMIDLTPAEPAAIKPAPFAVSWKP